MARVLALAGVACAGIAFAGVALACHTPQAKAAASATPTPARQPALRAELLRRMASDQAVREAFAASLRSGAAPDSNVVAQMMGVDRDNTAWMRGVLAQWGWPGWSLVGKDGAQAAFLLVQHADQDTSMQVRALPLLERAYRTGDAAGQDFALLTDRVAVARGQPQVYGTQADISNGVVRVKPIVDSAHVDARRASVGLPPLGEYVRMLDSAYAAHPPS